MTQFPLEQLLRLLSKEILRHKLKIAIAFAIISTTVVTVGLYWPKKYMSYSTVLAMEENIISPLMEGRATTTSVRDYSEIAREIIFSRKIMTEVLESAGVITEKTPPIERERIFEETQKRTEVSRAGNNIIRIEHRNPDPKIAYEVTKGFAELFIDESTAARRKESEEAFKFINNQVKEYHKKLTDAEEKLKDFRSSNVDASPGNEAEVNERISSLRRRIEQAQLELGEAKIRRTSLENQLSGEAEITLALSREGQYRNRIAELQTELDGLRLNYHDTYPDIVRIKHQIEDLKTAIEQEKQRREKLKGNFRDNNKTFVDEGVSLSPLYQQLRSELSQSKTQIATLESRIRENHKLLKDEIERARQIHDVEAGLAELTRDYNVNREIYQDLLRRKENAYVSMKIGMEQQGPGMKIQEPARLPLRPSGLRFLHFMIGSIVLGIGIPIGVIYLMITLDPRIRNEAVITEKFNLSLLAHVPAIMTNHEKVQDKREMIVAGFIFILVLTAVALLGTLRLTSVI